MKKAIIKFTCSDFDKKSFIIDLDLYIKNFLNEDETLVYEFFGDNIITIISNIEDEFTVVLYELLQGYEFETIYSN